MIGLNGLSILYGVARGVVAQATANCPHGKFILPSVNFIELMKSKAKESRTKKKRV
jgi:preprotein translocase subunit SecB